MIRVDENYIIEVDERCYAVKIDMHKEDKNGNPIYKPVGYYGDIEGAIKGIIKSKVNKSLSEEIHTLESALKCVVDTSKEFGELLKKVIEDGK